MLNVTISYSILYYFSSNLDLFLVTTLTWWVDGQTAASFHHLWPMAAVWSDSLQMCLKGLFCWDESLHFTAVNSCPAALSSCVCLCLCGCEDEAQLSAVFCPPQFFMRLITKNYHNLTPHHHLHTTISAATYWAAQDLIHVWHETRRVDSRLKFHKTGRDLFFYSWTCNNQGCISNFFFQVINTFINRKRTAFSSCN